MKLGDLTSGVGLAMLGGAIAVHAASFPRMPGHLYGAGLFPVAIGIGIVVCGVLLVLRGIASPGALRGVSLADWKASPRRTMAALLAILTPIAFIGLMETTGFLPIALVSLFAMLRVIGLAWGSSVITAALASVITYWLFAAVLRVPLPRGIVGFLPF